MFIVCILIYIKYLCISLFSKKYPDLSQHMVDMDMPWALIVTKWFICLFAEVLPIEVRYIFFV